MKSRVIKKIVLAFIFLWLLSSISFARKISEIDSSKLIEIAGKQRMLSQRIAKDYIYIGKKIAISKADKQLKESLNEFFKIHNELSILITDSEIKNLLDFVYLSSTELKEIANKDFTLDNAHLILDLTESMLEGNQYIVDSLKEAHKIKESNILEKVARQRMLSQRIAKYYIAYQAGIKDDNTVNSMKETIKQFSKNLKFLLANRDNTPQIDKKLKEIDRLWKIVHKFYSNIEKGGLPLIVFNTTDNITKKMDEITKLYIQKDK